MFGRSGWYHVQTCVRGFSKYCTTHQEHHTRQYSGFLWSCVCLEQVPWGNQHGFFPRRIPGISKSGIHILRARLRQHLQEDPPPSHRGPPLCHHRQPHAIEEAEGVGVSKFHPLPSTPRRGGRPGLQYFRYRASQDIFRQDSGSQIETRRQDNI